MRSFSNIMPNFADKLHLLVDSIDGELTLSRQKKRNEFLLFCSRLFVTLHAETN